MLITPRPGASRDHILKVLRDVEQALENVQTGGHPPYLYLLEYLKWVNRSTLLLRQQVSERDVEALVLTRGHATLLTSAGDLAQWLARDNAVGRMVGELVDLEVGQRKESLQAAIDDLEKAAARWSRPGWFVVADSSFYIQHHTMLADADLHAVLHLPADEAIHLLFPMAVIDELDSLKEASKSRPRWRASHTLGVLHGVLNDDGTGVLRQTGSQQPGTFSIAGQITVEIVFDPPGHIRLPNIDDEIIDRALAVQNLTGREVRLLTCDTGQSTRARTARLRVQHLPGDDLGPEPDWAAQRAEQDRAGLGGRAKRRERQRQQLETRERADNAGD